MPCRRRKFKYGNPGDPCCLGCVHSRTFHVRGCNSLDLQGATVEVLQGVTVVASGTTDSTGKWTVTGLQDGAYTYRITHTRFDTFTGGLTVSCPDSTATIGPVTLTPKSAYTCQWSTCALPVKKTLLLTTGLGSTPLAAQFDFLGNLTGYTSGTQTFGALGCSDNAISPSISYTVSKTGGGVYRLSSQTTAEICGYSRECACATPCYGFMRFDSSVPYGFFLGNFKDLGTTWCPDLDFEDSFPATVTESRTVECRFGSGYATDVIGYSIGWPVTDFVLTEAP